MDSVCTVANCDRKTIAKGLCMMHYKRQRAGRPLETPSKGDISGHGRYGILETDGERVLCHECGRWYTGLAAHAVTAHGMSAREYKIKHGLPLGKGLVSPRTSQVMAERARARLDTAAWKRLEEHRDPVVASHAHTEESFRSIATHQTLNPETSVTNLPQRSITPVTCVECGREWIPPRGARRRKTCSAECLRAHRSRLGAALHEPGLNADRDAQVRAMREEGVSVKEICEQMGLTRARIYQILRQD